MKEPRFTLTIEVTWNEYLGLLWELQGGMGMKADKQTVRKIAAFKEKFRREYNAWKRANFKCAQRVMRRGA